MNLYMKTKNIYMLSLLAGMSLPAMAQQDIMDSVAYKDQTVDIGANRPSPVSSQLLCQRHHQQGCQQAWRTQHW